MAVVMMCGANDPGAVRSEYWSKEGRDIYTYESYKGLVLSLREMNGYDDSDFYATVWNEEKGEPEELMYASTRGWTYPNGAAIDASAEVLAKYDAYNAAILASLKAAAEAKEAKMPRKGKRVRTVRAVRGKNAIEAGVTGKVFWVGLDKFSPSTGYYGNRVANPKMRIGLATDDGRKVFIAASAVEVIEEEVA